MNESKTECTAYAAPFDFTGVIHLFQHKYADLCEFWHGMIDATCDRETFDELCGRMNNLEPIRFTVKLADGREGYAQLRTARRSFGSSGECVLLAVVGVSSLDVDERFHYPDLPGPPE
jgi:hypothetical protein